MWKIKRGTLEAVLLAARNTFPNEFFCLLGGDKKKKTINEFVVIPAVFGRQHTIVQDWLKPVDSSIVGSMHSHPSRNNFPSGADLDVFPGFGEIHLIVGYPFRLNDTKLFDLKGREQGFEVVE